MRAALPVLTWVGVGLGVLVGGAGVGVDSALPVGGAGTGVGSALLQAVSRKKMIVRVINLGTVDIIVATALGGSPGNIFTSRRSGWFTTSLGVES